MKFTVVLSPEGDGGYSVVCPAIPGCVSQGESLEEALVNVREAILLCLEVRHDEGMPARKETPEQMQAIELAREILDLYEFRDLELLGGLVRKQKREEEKRPRRPQKPLGERTGARSDESGDRRDPKGLRINYSEIPFEDSSSRHSRFLGGTVQVNTLNPDYLQEMQGPHTTKLAYATLMIGKETIAYNDKTGNSDDLLEKLLSFYFRLKGKVAPGVAVASHRSRGRPRKVA